MSLKLKTLFFVTMLLTAFAFSSTKIKAYSPLNIASNEVQLNTLTWSIVGDDSMGSNWYRFSIVFYKPYTNSKYLLFGNIVNDNVFITNTNGSTFSYLFASASNTSILQKDWYFYIGSNIAPWSSNTALGGFYIWVYSTAGGATAQTIVETYCTTYFYLYYDNVNTTEANVVSAFTERYVDASTTEAYNSGYSSGWSDGSHWGYDEGYLYGEVSGYSNGYNIGYNTGVSDTENNNVTLLAFIPSMIGAVASFFLTLASFEFMGISILGVLIIMASIGAVLLVLKFIRG